MSRPTRRQFVVHTALGFGAYVFGVYGVGCKKPEAPKRTPDEDAATLGKRSPAGTFTALQFATLHAASERILPHDEDPGAIELGVPQYLDRALADPSIDFLKRPLLIILDGAAAQAKQKYS